MANIIAAFIVVGALMLLCYLVSRVVDGDWLSKVALFSYCTLLIALLMYGADKIEEKEGPCVEYKTEMMYNAGTKTMMPARYCVKRGEWVDE